VPKMNAKRYYVRWMTLNLHAGIRSGRKGTACMPRLLANTAMKAMVLLQGSAIRTECGQTLWSTLANGCTAKRSTRTMQAIPGLPGRRLLLKEHVTSTLKEHQLASVTRTASGRMKKIRASPSVARPCLVLLILAKLSSWTSLYQLM